ncbi:hypothetical protein IWW38_000600 [Coemansia aciculifera]|uniref:Uncharacterized protein n=1 Tax=Coemansia aciculifera TaxID=417176 RepID=A0ACC1MAK3_9FUNG|nr:hypothetical protein IWW38_000600 [Coemansia aciculifera]
MKFGILSLAAAGLLAGVVSGFQPQQQQHHFAHHHSASADIRTSSDFTPGKLYDSQRLIKVSAAAKPRWLALEDILVLRRAGVRFMDITDTQALHTSSSSSSASGLVEGYTSRLPTKLVRGEEVAAAVEGLTTKLYGDVLRPFTAFHNRYYDSENGRKSSEWLQGQIQDLVAASGANVSVSAFSHRFPQSSIIARFEGQGSDSSETVVVSAHQDSVNQWLPWFGRANGADDDGSGTVTILEAFRVLLQRGFAPRRAVEFHWYAGEEGGLLGSQDVALAYKKAGRHVAVDLHFDMTGFWRGEQVIGLVSDHTDPESRALVKRLAAAYTRLATKEFACGYGCSDHASWNTAGFRSAMAFESAELEGNTNIHSPRDTVDTLDFDHMLEFSKLAVAFAYEVGYDKASA